MTFWGSSFFVFKKEADVHCGGRFPRARLLPLPSLRSVQWLQLALVPQESPPPFPSAVLKRKKDTKNRPFLLNGSYQTTTTERTIFMCNPKITIPDYKPERTVFPLSLEEDAYGTASFKLLSKRVFYTMC
jgi:hypothetical protein